MTANGWPASIRSMRPGTPSTDSSPARTAAGSRPSASPSATTASALWTLKRPASRSSRRAAAGRRGVARRAGGARPPRPRSRARRPRGRCRRSARSRPPRGRPPRTTTRPGRPRLTIATLGHGRPPTILAGFCRVVTAAGEGLEQPQLGRPVRLERAVELEVLVGEVREHRGVAGDPEDAVELERVRRRLEDGDLRCRRGPSPRASPAARARRASSRGRRGARARRPTFVSTVPMRPAESPAASSAATARNEVVVLPSVPVIPIAPSARDGSPYHQRRPGRGRARAEDTTSCGSARPAPGARRSPPPRRPPAAPATKSWPSTWKPGTATNSVPAPDRPRVVGDAPDLDVGQPGGPDRQVVPARAADEVGRPQARDQTGEGLRPRRFRGREQVGDVLALGLGRSRPAPPPDRAATRAAARPAA